MHNYESALEDNKLAEETVRAFQERIYAYFREHGREMPWRRERDPYRILVSEIMLQQTQVERVLPKYTVFISRFPDFLSLAEAEFRDVLTLWKGLGYNRRALALQRTAQRVIADHGGRLPDSIEALTALPGIGHATAGALTAFAFEKPVVFIETNIRRVYLHEFFPDRDAVKDREIEPLVERTLDRENVRTWYYALMDYGASLKRTERNPNRRSAHYHRQAGFEGSDRRIRGLILEVLIERSNTTSEEIERLIDADPDRIERLIGDLEREGLLTRRGAEIRIA